MSSQQPPLLFRIYLVRQLLNDALQHAGDTFPVTRMRVILSLDHAIEILVSTLLPELRVIVDRSWGLPKMMQELCTQKPALQSHRTPIERLRRLRDRVQHDGIVPSSEDIRQATVQAEAFIRDVVREVLDKELEEFSPVMLIYDEKARERLQKAEQALRQRDYSTAVIEAATGFAIGWANFRFNLFSRFHRRSWSHQIAEELIRGIGNAARKAARDVRETTLQRFAERFKRELIGSFELREKFEELTEPIELARYGIDMQGYARFQQVTPHVYLVMGRDEPRVLTSPDWTPSQQDALFALDFAVTALLQLQRWMGESEVQGGESNHAP